MRKRIPSSKYNIAPHADVSRRRYQPFNPRPSPSIFSEEGIPSSISFHTKDCRVRDRYKPFGPRPQASFFCEETHTVVNITPQQTLPCHAAGINHWTLDSTRQFLPRIACRTYVDKSLHHALPCHAVRHLQLRFLQLLGSLHQVFGRSFSLLESGLPREELAFSLGGVLFAHSGQRRSSIIIAGHTAVGAVTAALNRTTRGSDSRHMLSGVPEQASGNRASTASGEQYVRATPGYHTRSPA